MADIHPYEDFSRFLDEGKFMLLRSSETGRYIFYPRVVEPETGSTDLEWVEASGLGVVHSTTVIRQRPPAEDYNLSLIDLEEGPRMMSRVIGISPEEVKIGQEVKAKIIQDDAPLLVFEPV